MNIGAKVNQLSEEELAFVREKSFRNMVEFHRYSLKRIMWGENASKVFSDDERETLKRHKIITLAYGFKRGRWCAVTPKAQQVLNQLEEESL